MSNHRQIPQRYIPAFNQLVELYDKHNDAPVNKKRKATFFSVRLQLHQEKWNHRVEAYLRKQAKHGGTTKPKQLTDVEMLVVGELSRLNSNFEHYLDLKRYEASLSIRSRMIDLYHLGADHITVEPCTYGG